VLWTNEEDPLLFVMTITRSEVNVCGLQNDV